MCGMVELGWIKVFMVIYYTLKCVFIWIFPSEYFNFIL